MGDPKRLRRKYEPPRHPWEKTRIEEEKGLVNEYGLKNKKELWKAKSAIKRYRHIARELIGQPPAEREEKEKAFLGKLHSLGLLPEKATLDDVLSLDVKGLLERRLQTIVWKNGMTKTIKQARQLIVHGHIAVDGRKTSAPGRIIDAETENKVGWYKKPVDLEAKPQRKVKKKEEVKEEVEKAEEPVKEEGKEKVE